jgi:hypothetical protein
MAESNQYYYHYIQRSYDTQYSLRNIFYVIFVTLQLTERNDIFSCAYLCVNVNCDNDAKNE